MKYLILLAFLSSQANATVIHLNAGDKAPNSGYLFNEDEAQNTRSRLLDCEDLNAISVSLQKSIDIYKQNQNLYSEQTTILLNQNQKLLEADKSASSLSTLEKFGYFAMGVLAAGVSFFVAEKAISNR